MLEEARIDDAHNPQPRPRCKDGHRRRLVQALMHLSINDKYRYSSIDLLKILTSTGFSSLKAPLIAWVTELVPPNQHAHVHFTGKK